MRFLYSLALYLIAPFVCAMLLWRGLRDRSYWHHFAERFGFGEAVPAGGIWVHAVSVGEVQAAAALVNRLRERYSQVPLVVTTFTPTGAARARALFETGVRVRYVPFDLPGSVRRFFGRIRPRIAVIFETELWPNLYHERARLRIPLVLASARISRRSVAGYRRLGSLFREPLGQGIVIAAQAQVDAERFQALGADATHTHVTGNIKFDLAVPPDIEQRGTLLRQQYAAGRPMWVAGSTHAGEDEIVLEAHAGVRRKHPGALLAIAPRHPNRFDEVAAGLERARVSFRRRSREASATTAPTAAFATTAPAASDPEVLLVDTLGELLDFYAAGDVAFVGGSLVPIGGHNLLEPAALGKPVLTGPHNSNGAEVAKLLISRGAAKVVTDAEQLRAAVDECLCDPVERERIGAIGRGCVADNRGALAKLLGLIEPLMRD